ncbi:hypothetical protein VTK73DRAFT_333 [Phialemonium thermophilum]|uniref:Branched-chain-amino-acid aminotransferase n=1 Tax=Phialemonium thermophilum TaxID=223376 RepID=A0ABR3XFE8_9PEZI
MAENFQLFTSFRFDPALCEAPEGALQYADWNRANASPFYMLDYHRDRMLRGATHFGWDAAVKALSGEDGIRTLSEFVLDVLRDKEARPMRVKVTVSKEGNLAAETNVVPRTSIANLFPAFLPVPGQAASAGPCVPEKEPLYEVVVDSTTTDASEYTHYKTTRRQMYDEARRRAGIDLTSRKEVLLVNSATGCLMEGSMTTPYFWRDGRWVTPPVSLEFRPQGDSGGNDGTTRRWALQRALAVEEEVPVDSLRDGEECWLSNGVRGFMCGKIVLQNPEP